MTVDLCIKSFSGDYEWLKYSLRSIQRFARGFRRVVVIVPNGETPPTGTAEVVFHVEEQGEPYLFQQVIKLHADHFSDAEFITFLDSDTILTRTITPDDLIENRRKPIWLYTPYSSIDSGDGQTWKEPTAKVIGHPVEHEFMRRHCFTIPRWALQGFREWMHKIHGMTLERYILSQPNKSFSEFNAIGAWLWCYHRDRIAWQNTDEDMGIPYVHQSWSHGGINDDLRKHLEAALA